MMNFKWLVNAFLLICPSLLFGQDAVDLDVPFDFQVFSSAEGVEELSGIVRFSYESGSLDGPDITFLNSRGEESPELTRWLGSDNGIQCTWVFINGRWICLGGKGPVLITLSEGLGGGNSPVLVPVWENFMSAPDTGEDGVLFEGLRGSATILPGQITVLQFGPP